MARNGRGAGPSEALSNFVVEWRPGEAWPVIEQQATRALIDLVGVMLAGTREPASILATAHSRREGGPGEAVVVGHGFRTSATGAAFANGTSGHALDFDDIGDTAGGGHRTVCLAPSALAAAETSGGSGRSVLEAIAVGFEVIARLGRSAGGERGECYARGFHGTSVFGVFGAAAAAARVFGLDRDAMARTFGIVASGAKGLRANYGTMTKPLHAGEANRSGVAAALLAGAGFDASRSAIEGRFGWSEALVGAQFDAQAITCGLGDHLAIETDLNLKPFPTCAANDAPVRALLGLLAEEALTAEEVARVEVEISANVLEKTLLIDWPRTGLEGKFSLSFNLAAALVDHKVTLSSFEDANVTRLAPYRERIIALPKAGRPPVVVHIETADGRRFTRVEPTRVAPLEEDELAAKFRENARLVRPPEQVEEIYATLVGLGGAESLGALSAPLA